MKGHKAVQHAAEYGDLVPTKSFTAFRTMLGIFDKFQSEGRFGVVTGEAGMGKTESCLFWMAHHSDYYLRTQSVWGKVDFLRALAKSIGMDVIPGISGRIMEKVLDRLKNIGKVLYVDEADKLSYDKVEMLRDITDITYCPIVLAGEPLLERIMERNSRLSSRTPFRIKMAVLGTADVLTYNQKRHGLDVTPEIGAMIADVTGGNFRDLRRLMIIIADQAAANGSMEVTEKMVKVAVNTTLRGGRR